MDSQKIHDMIHKLRFVRNAIREHEKRSRKYYGDHGTVPPKRDLDLWKTLEGGS